MLPEKDELSTKDVYSELARLQQLILANQRYILLGQMVSTLIHDLNNPLTAINGNIELLQLSPINNDAKVKKRLDAVQNNSKRMATKLRELQLLTKSVQIETAVEVNQVVREITQAALYLPKASRIAPTLVLSDEPIMFKGQANQLALALLAIIENALDSVGNSTDPQVTISTEKSGEELIIKIANNGSEIPQAIGEKIFEPFFTTKPNALGIGLSLAQQFVKAHQGQLTYTSQPAKTEFTLQLPLQPSHS